MLVKKGGSAPGNVNGVSSVTDVASVSSDSPAAPSGSWQQVVVQEAWDETIKTAVGDKVIQNDTGTDMSGWSSKQKLDWCESHNCPNHCDDYDPSQPGYCACNCSISTVYETTTVHHEAVIEWVWVEG